MRYYKLLILGLFAGIGWYSNARAQTISKDELVFFTSEWKGERFADGRPKIPDDIIERAKKIGIEEAWTVLKNEGYNNQFEGGWKLVNDTLPVVGRAVTAMFMPSRPDIEKSIKERGLKQGRKGNTNAWPIETLTKGDVYVADGFGKVKGGTLIGDNLGNSIFSKSGNGVIFDGSARDLQGLKEIHGFNAFVRDFDPSYLEEMVLMGLNTPIRIGRAVVLPGDLVISEKEGVLFIPAHLAEKVVATAEFIALRDEFGHAMLKSGRFATGEIDSQWTSQVKDAFMKWLDQNPGKMKMTRAQLDAFMEKRTW
ncbi:RraA family protein [Mucilaginibacter sp. AW1-7]|jgi:regulator of RNase E activity RraA|uniref:RraA family protein n=1 Tax=unclassified Mucilaginibacter TaxID=2617802 RepID=UPI002366CA82|nr:RraA family protein [Mucilaginibacter sp. KACC 22773]WDF79326.1 RraA family protein [Mucilaginibacter sp. KACC 22773]